jgi:glucose-1-phosphate adenylyltransferase
MESVIATAATKQESPEGDLQSQRFVSRLTKNTLALILAGGAGSRLRDLTLWRAKPAVPFGGQFRIIDFPLSNCVNSDIRRIGVLTQYKAHSLIRHIQKGWGFFRGEFNEFLELLPAQQRIENDWYLGTANAVYQNIDILRSHKTAYVLILAGDHVYKMDYGPMLAYHVQRNADLTVGCIEVPVEEGSAYGVMHIDEDNQIREFAEKPSHPPPIPGQDKYCLASMGIYVFSTEFLIEQLIKDADRKDSSHDFGRDVIPHLINRFRVFAYPFHSGYNNRRAYWRDVGTVDAYWQANMELIDVTPELNLYDREWPIWTFQEQTPPAKFVFNDNGRRGCAIDSMVAGGCIISGATIQHSLLSNNVTVGENSQVVDSVILPEVRIGSHCRVRRAVIDKGTVLADNTVIGEDSEADKRNFHVSLDGVVLVTPDMLGQQLHHAR